MRNFDFSEYNLKTRKLSDLSCVYVLETRGSSFFKIGFAKKLSQRISNIQSGCPYELFILNCASVPNHREIEKYLHNYYSDYCVRGEWFDLKKDQLDELFDFFYEIGQSLRKSLRGE